MPRTKLTQLFVDQFCPSGKEIIFFDTELPGFGIRIAPKGTKSYIIQKRINGRERKQMIGRANILKLSEARNRAKSLIGQISDGNDPFARSSEAVTSFQSLFDVYVVEHAKKLKKPRSCKEDQRLIKNHLLPRLSRISPEALARQDVTDLKLHIAGDLTPAQARGSGLRLSESRLKGGRVTANRCLSLLSKVYNFGSDHGYIARKDNPVVRVPHFRERRREEYLDRQEIFALQQAFRASLRLRTERRSAVDAIEVLLLTGARLSEIRLLRWAEVDLNDGVIFKADTKTGAREIFICERTKRILERRLRVRKGQSEFVFPGQKSSRPITLAKPWRRIREMANLSADYSLHTLRHTFATQAAINNISPHRIQKLLGHQSLDTTSIYITIAKQTSKQDVQDISQILNKRRN